MDRPAAEIESAIIDAPCGRVAGVRISDVFVFKGIPYAKPRVGECRWRWPEPLPPWAGVRDAAHFGPICPQAPTQIEALLGGSLGEQSEDCLHLNVWTPGCDDARRPVMVWIHGGAFVIGAGSQGLYNGRHLAEHDRVIVTINYRLGVFGFLNLSDATGTPGSGSGAEGIADQVMALRWVQQNIAVFGGDPDNVTIFGESAGAHAVATLLAVPDAKGCFARAISESPAAGMVRSPEIAAQYATKFAALLGARGDD